MAASRDAKVKLKFSIFFSNSLFFFSIEAFGVEVSLEPDYTEFMNRLSQPCELKRKQTS